MERFKKFREYSMRVLNRSKTNEEATNFNLITDFKEEKCSIIWRIENIHRCRLKCGEFFESPQFSTMFSSEVKWTMKIYPRGRKIENLRQKQICPEHNKRADCETVGLFVNRISANSVTSPYRYRFAYKRDLLHSATSKQKLSHILPEEGIITGEVDSESSEFGTDILCCAESLTPPQIFLVRFDIFVTKAYNKEVTGNYMPGLLKPFSLCQDLKEMFESGKFSDVTLKARDVMFPAHKAILASRSEVFDAMFKHDMKETQTNVVEIEDAEPAVLRNMLQYIYTGNVEDFNIDKAIALYSVADKYFLEELKQSCIDVMLANLTVENVCQIAVLVELHPDPKLKKAAFDMFRSYTGDIFKKKEWQDLVQNSDRRALVSDILQAVSADFTTNLI